MPTKTVTPPPTIGEKILYYRTKAKVTQLRLAHLIGYTGDSAGAYISRLESNTQSPGLETLRKLAKALGVGIEKLIS